MPFHDAYRAQVALLLRTLPLVAEEKAFALKGGTAINLFVRPMPRLSVDIDLTYLPIEDRATSLAAINAAMERTADRIRSRLRGSTVSVSRLRPENAATKVIVRLDGVQIKIEVTPVLRGTVYKPGLRSVTKPVEAAFGFAEIQVTSLADLYAGKIVAALDRQHPRDLFDVRELLANEGISDDLRRAFIVYIASHDRPMAEVLAPGRRDIEAEFRRGFDGMTDAPVSLDDLLATREEIIATMVAGMPYDHRSFLIGFKSGEPDWSTLGVPGAETLPAVRWKLQNLDKLGAQRRAELVEALERVLR
jgi:predicted nucleotidyltransferase component of viral defense system